MKVLQVCAYAAQYPGNFINLLHQLSKTMEQQGYTTIYAFPETAQKLEWIKELEETHAVYFLPLAKARVKPSTYSLFKRIYKENPDIKIVHSHFELYDVPATVMASKGVKVFWHLHDPITIEKGLHGLMEQIQYGAVSRFYNVTLISVAEEYRKRVVGVGFPQERTRTVLNGIVTQRIADTRKSSAEKQYDFLTFGWDFMRKGVDLILSVCERLREEGYQFKLYLNGNDETWRVFKEYWKGSTPSYLICGNPTNDINSLFTKAKVFISASRAETFSYAICEAAYSGLPVISSDIPGVEWAHKLPTVSFFEAGGGRDELFRLMKEYLDGKKVMSKDVDVTRRIIEKEFSSNCWVMKIMDCYGLFD